MKKILRKIGNYFVNLYRAIFNIKVSEAEKYEKDFEALKSKYKGKLPEKDKLLDKFDVEYIKKIIERTPVHEGQDNDVVQQQFIANREAINEYKYWYNKLVGYKKPPELLKKLIDADLKMDRVEMDRIFREMHNADFEKWGIEQEQKRKEGDIIEQIRKHSSDTPKSQKLDLEEILRQAKEKL